MHNYHFFITDDLAPLLNIPMLKDFWRGEIKHNLQIESITADQLTRIDYNTIKNTISKDQMGIWLMAFVENFN